MSWWLTDGRLHLQQNCIQHEENNHDHTERNGQRQQGLALVFNNTLIYIMVLVRNEKGARGREGLERPSKDPSSLVLTTEVT